MSRAPPTAESRRFTSVAVLVGAHPAGTVEIQKVIIARRIGISRTRERAAATPSTAGVAGV